jgi:hypothetical protein
MQHSQEIPGLNPVLWVPNNPGHSLRVPIITIIIIIITTENSHNGHFTPTPESRNVKVQNFSWEVSLHVP